MTWRKSTFWPLNISLFSLPIFSHPFHTRFSLSSASVSTHSFFLSLFILCFLALPFSSLTHISCNLQWVPKFCAFQHKRWMNDLLHLCDCYVCAEGLRVYRRCVCVFGWDMMQTEQAVSLLCRVFDVLSKNHHTNTLKNTLSVSCSLIPFSLTYVQMAFIGIKYKASYCRNKSSSCKQHEIVIEGEKKHNCQKSLLGWCQKSSSWLNPIFALKRPFNI